MYFCDFYGRGIALVSVVIIVKLQQNLYKCARFIPKKRTKLLLFHEIYKRNTFMHCGKGEWYYGISCYDVPKNIRTKYCLDTITITTPVP